MLEMKALMRRQRVRVPAALILRQSDAKNLPTNFDGFFFFFFFFLFIDIAQPILRQGAKLGVPTHNREAWPYKGVFVYRNQYPTGSLLCVLLLLPTGDSLPRN